MDNFKQFMETTDQQDALASIKKLPKSHQALVKGFSIHFQPNGTLKGDDKHIGKIEAGNKLKITLAAPFYYGREFALLHEIGHLVWEKFIAHNPDLETKWNKLCASVENKVKDNNEELFAHSYANLYCHNKIIKHNHPKLEKFIREI